MTAYAYPRVEGEPLSTEYAVCVNGQDVPVYTARVDAKYQRDYGGLIFDDTYSFAGFDCDGVVDLVVESSVPLTALSVRGVSGPRTATLDGGKATFKLDQHCTYLIERNGNGRKDLLLLSANPMMVDAPQKCGPAVVYFGPGRHDAGLIELTDGQTLYMDGGAVVTGRIEARGDNIRICGRGVLENEGDAYYGKPMLLLDHCRNAVVEGIVMRKNSRHWTVVPHHCDGVTISNIKICGSNAWNDDGIDPVNTRNMTIDNCFIRTGDDCLAFKGMDDALSNCENITVSNTMLWSDGCCAILLGDESRASFMRNITIRNCFVPYMSIERWPKKFLMLHAGEEMNLEQVRIENIEIGGDGQNCNYIEMACEYNQWCKSQTAGRIRDIVLKNVRLTGKKGGYFIVLKGFDKQHKIEGVVFEDCTINGKAITADYPGLETGAFVEGLRFITAS